MLFFFNSVLKLLELSPTILNFFPRKLTSNLSGASAFYFFLLHVQTFLEY